jgi:hypothetical protein
MTNVSRRAVIKAGVALGAAGLVAPPILSFGRGEKPIKVGMIDPITGTYAALGTREITSAKLAVAQLNRKGGILGRRGELARDTELVERLAGAGGHAQKSGGKPGHAPLVKPAPA